MAGVVSVRLTDELAAEVRSRAADRQMNVNQYIKAVVLESLDRPREDVALDLQMSNLTRRMRTFVTRIRSHAHKVLDEELDMLIEDPRGETIDF